LSNDKGGSWTTLATTQHGMFGFALSPDGANVAFGSPGDGLSVGPSDGSQPFTKVADLQVRCLRWDAAGVYACGTEPGDPFTMGLSTDHGASFRPIYKIADTCPQVCSNAAQFAMACRAPWTTIGPLIQASSGSCSLPWAGDAALGADAGAHPGTKGGSSCSMSRIAPAAGSEAERTAISCALVALGLRRRRRPSRRANARGAERETLVRVLAVSTFLLLGCGATGQRTAADGGGGSGAGGAFAFDAEIPLECPQRGATLANSDTYVAGLEKTGHNGLLSVRLLDAEPPPPTVGNNTWKIQVGRCRHWRPSGKKNT
jgi:hypothetical protein